MLVLISVGAWKQRIERPYIPVGWLWFLGTLVPVIGIMQVGDQAMADRYAYLPLIGLFVIVVWGLHGFITIKHLNPTVAGALAVVVLGLFSLVTLRQLDYWQDSFSLWSRALQVTTDNLNAEEQMGSLPEKSGHADEAIPHHFNVIRINPKIISSRVNIGVYYATHGRMQDALPMFETVMTMTDHPNLTHEDHGLRSSAALNLGLAHLYARDYPNVLTRFRQASESDPVFIDQVLAKFVAALAATPGQMGYLELGLLLQSQGKSQEALSALINAIREHPDYSDAKILLLYLSEQPR